jgi:hypothetical protein
MPGSKERSILPRRFTPSFLIVEGTTALTGSGALCIFFSSAVDRPTHVLDADVQSVGGRTFEELDEEIVDELG